MFEGTIHSSEPFVSASHSAFFSLKGPIRTGYSQGVLRVVIRPAVSDKAGLWKDLASRMAPAFFAVLAKEYQRRLPGRSVPFSEDEVRSSLESLGRSYQSDDYAGSIEWLIWEDAKGSSNAAREAEFDVSLRAAVDAANAAHPLELFMNGFLGLWSEIIRGGPAETVLMPISNGVGFFRIPVDTVDEWSYSPEHDVAVSNGIGSTSLQAV